MHFAEAKSILMPQNGMNIYRGCTHGCIYCDSRSACYGFTHPFDDVEVKINAPELLEKALRSKRQRCMIATGSMCDPYLHAEEELRLTRRCVELIDQYGFGLAIQTKSDRILRDLDLFRSINSHSKCVVQMTLTTYDDGLCGKIEPDVCNTRRRVEVLRIFRDEGIPTVVWLTPILPFINDTRENIEGILDMCVEARVKGIICFNMGVTLREGDREYFYAALDRDFPGLRQRYVSRYGGAYEVVSENSPALMRLLRETCAREGIMCSPDEVFSYLHTYETGAAQLSLFDS